MDKKGLVRMEDRAELARETESHGRKIVRIIESFFSEGVDRLTQAKKLLDAIGAEHKSEGNPMENAMAHMNDLIHDFLQRAHRLPGMVVKEESEDDEIVLIPFDAKDRRYAKELLDYLRGMHRVGPFSPEAVKELNEREPERRTLWNYLSGSLMTVMKELMTICGETTKGESVH